MVKLGAVPFCQTNVPQALFTMQTSNPLYGATGNPLDKDRECGGSTGGEGSLTATHVEASPMKLRLNACRGKVLASMSVEELTHNSRRRRRGA